MTCTLFPSPDDHAGKLVAWLEAEFLAREMPRLLRLLQSLALRFAHEIEGKAPVPFGGRSRKEMARTGASVESGPKTALFRVDGPTPTRLHCGQPPETRWL